MTRFLTALALFAVLSINSARVGIAQHEFEPGAVVTISGDTLVGKIDNREWVRNPESITFITGQGEQRHLTTDDITAFSVSGDHFVRRKVQIDQTQRLARRLEPVAPSSREAIVFLRMIVDGPMRLFAYSNERIHYFVEDASGTHELISHQYVIQRDGGPYQLVKNEAFRSQVQAYGRQCPDVNASRIRYSEASFRSFFHQCNLATGSADAVSVFGGGPLTVRHYVETGLARTSVTPLMDDRDLRLTGPASLNLGYYVAVDRPRGRGRTSIVVGLNYLEFTSQSASRSAGVPVWSDDMTSSYRRIQATGSIRQRFGNHRFQPFIDTGFSLAAHYHTEEASAGPANARLYPGFHAGPGVEVGRFAIATSYERILSVSRGLGVGLSFAVH